MVYFTDVQPTKHYLEEHEKQVSWHKVVEILLTTKNPRKKGSTFEIEKDNYYIVFTIRDGILYVINAKEQKK